MLNETFADKILLKIEAKKVAHRRNKGMNPREIAQEMNCSEDWVKELFEEWRLQKQEAKQ